MSSSRVSAFSLKALSKHKELIPLVCVLGAAVTGGTLFMGYALYTKPDVRVIRSRGPAHDDVEPTELRKLYSVNQKPQSVPEVEQLRREIGSYKSY